MKKAVQIPNLTKSTSQFLAIVITVGHAYFLNEFSTSSKIEDATPAALYDTHCHVKQPEHRESKFCQLYFANSSFLSPLTKCATRTQPNTPAASLKILEHLLFILNVKLISVLDPFKSLFFALFQETIHINKTSVPWQYKNMQNVLQQAINITIYETNCRE